jgi:uncharacterized protein
MKRQKRTVHMDVATGKNAVDWLLAASGNAHDLSIHFMGGEPLLRFDFIKQIVQYGTCRARQAGKNIQFGATTNSTLVTDEIVAFWRHYKMRFHCSIDGIPEVQNANRPMLSGAPSSPAVEKNVPKILAYQPGVTARATITPRSAPALFESVKYLVKLGFKDMTFIAAANCDWRPEDFQAVGEQYAKVAEFYIDSLVAGKPLRIGEFDKAVRQLHSPEAGPVGCGAGRGMAMINAKGDIWPCHRYGPHLCGGQMRLGSLGAPYNDRLRNVFLNTRMAEDYKPECKGCPAHLTCTNWCTAECLDCTHNMFDPSGKFCQFAKTFHEQVLNFHNHLRARHPKILANLLKEN